MKETLILAIYDDHTHGHKNDVAEATVFCPKWRHFFFVSSDQMRRLYVTVGDETTSNLSCGCVRMVSLHPSVVPQEPRREADASATACAHTLSRAFTSLGSSPVSTATNSSVTAQHCTKENNAWQQSKHPGQSDPYTVPNHSCAC